MAAVLVFGREGRTARALAASRAASRAGVRRRDRLDLAAPSPDIAGLIAEVRPDAVINAAAFTAVDRAEAETAANERLNHDAPAAMGRACAAAAIPFIPFHGHVFDGEKGRPVEVVAAAGAMAGRRRGAKRR